MYLGVRVYVRTSMEQNSFWEDNTAPPSQESPRILWNPNVHYGLPLTHFLIHINEIRSLRPSLWIIILMLSSCLYPGPSSGTFPQIYSPKFCLHFSFHPFLSLAPLPHSPCFHRRNHVYLLSSANHEFSFHVRDQASRLYKTTDKIVIMYILFFIFLDRKRENKRFWA